MGIIQKNIKPHLESVTRTISVSAAFCPDYLKASRTEQMKKKSGEARNTLGRKDSVEGKLHDV